RQYAQMAGLLEKIATAWRESGIRLCYHPHVATYIEAPHEVDQLMSMTDPELIKLGPDTGHLSLGGGDPIAITRRYLSRLGGVHLKDIDRAVAKQARQDQL
ncbi:MAG: TIM barrel protein, partial [Anaerolineae bacterium]|nr:TIM barrel protein [Anaerolineae bacterium]